MDRGYDRDDDRSARKRQREDSPRREDQSKKSRGSGASKSNKDKKKDGKGDGKRSKNSKGKSGLAFFNGRNLLSRPRAAWHF